MFVFTYNLRYGAKDPGFTTKVIASCESTAREKMQRLHSSATVTLLDMTAYQSRLKVPQVSNSERR